MQRFFQRRRIRTLRLVWSLMAALALSLAVCSAIFTVWTLRQTRDLSRSFQTLQERLEQVNPMARLLWFFSFKCMTDACMHAFSSTFVKTVLTNHAVILQLIFLLITRLFHALWPRKPFSSSFWGGISWGMWSYNSEALDYTNIQLRHRWGSAGRVFMALPDFARGVLWVMAYLVSKVAAKCDGFVANFATCLGLFTGNLRLLGTSASRNQLTLPFKRSVS